jgi:hypothetical protein
MDSHKFATLPPFFPTSEGIELARAALSRCFSYIPDELRRILPFCLASLVYHRVWLRQTLPANHRLSNTAIFASKLDEELSQHVACRIPLEDDPITATGVPPHVHILHQVDESVPRVIAGVSSELERRATDSGSITRACMENCMETVLERRGILSSTAQPVALQPTQEQMSKKLWHYWGGKFRRIPEGFQFPSGGLIVAWQQYCCGDAARGIGPLRLVRFDDFDERNMRKRLCEYHALMKVLQAEANRLNCWKDNLSL